MPNGGIQGSAMCDGTSQRITKSPAMKKTPTLSPSLSLSLSLSLSHTDRMRDGTAAPAAATHDQNPRHQGASRPCPQVSRVRVFFSFAVSNELI